MAYSNWGAFVYENGKRRQDKEDVGVFDTDESESPSCSRIFANIMKLREMFPDGDAPRHMHSRHAVLGDAVVRLCGYKDQAELWVYRDSAVERIDIPTDEGGVEVDGVVWKYSFKMYDGNMIDLELTEPNGIVWTATCGYCYGAGHMD